MVGCLGGSLFDNAMISESEVVVGGEVEVGLASDGDMGFLSAFELADLSPKPLLLEVFQLTIELAHKRKGGRCRSEGLMELGIPGWKRFTPGRDS